mgnify:FL=1
MIMNRPPEEEYDSREKHGWTLWKEVYGTFLGFLPFALALVAWWSYVNGKLAEHDLKLITLEKADDRHERETDRNRVEVLQRLDRIGGQIENLQTNMAKTGTLNR